MNSLKQVTECKISQVYALRELGVNEKYTVYAPST